MKDRKTDRTGAESGGNGRGKSTGGPRSEPVPVPVAGVGVASPHDLGAGDRRKRILVTLLVDKTERQALRILAESDHTSQSAWMRKIIREEARALAADLRRRGKRVEKGLDL